VIGASRCLVDVVKYEDNGDIAVVPDGFDDLHHFELMV
jgi:hypothetical protein